MRNRGENQPDKSFRNGGILIDSRGIERWIRLNFYARDNFPSTYVDALILPVSVLFILSKRLLLAPYYLFRHRFRSEKPPTLAEFLLYLLLCKEDRDIIPGDLAEEFTTVILPKFGSFRAWFWYWVRAFLAIAYRNPLCRWLLVGGGILKLGEWVTRQLRG
jgi:hypothetical protein